MVERSLFPRSRAGKRPSMRTVLDRTKGSMGRCRPVIRLCALLAAVVLIKGCGDGESAIAPPPDPRRATNVAVSPATADLSALGATVQLTVEVRDQGGNVIAGATVAWTSNAASVATVDAAGLVTAVGNGTATITAASGGVSGTATVTVAIVPLSRDLEIYMATEDDRHAVENPETLRMFPGHWLRATVRRPEALWHVSDTSVVQVRRGRAPDGSALRSEHDVSIDPLAPGEVMLTVSHDGRARFATITVGEAALLAERSLMDRH